MTLRLSIDTFHIETCNPAQLIGSFTADAERLVMAHIFGARDNAGDFTELWLFKTLTREGIEYGFHKDNLGSVLESTYFRPTGNGFEWMTITTPLYPGDIVKVYLILFDENGNVVEDPVSGTIEFWDVGNGASALGAGSISWPITINANGSPVDGVDVWITTDEAGSNVIARGDTNDNGIVTFLLDAGSYYAWKQLAGYSFTNPESFTVS